MVSSTSFLRPDRQGRLVQRLSVELPTAPRASKMGHSLVGPLPLHEAESVPRARFILRSDFILASISRIFSSVCAFTSQQVLSGSTRRDRSSRISLREKPISLARLMKSRRGIVSGGYCRYPECRRGGSGMSPQLTPSRKLRSQPTGCAFSQPSTPRPQTLLHPPKSARRPNLHPLRDPGAIRRRSPTEAGRVVRRDRRGRSPHSPSVFGDLHRAESTPLHSRKQTMSRSRIASIDLIRGAVMILRPQSTKP